MRIRLVGSLLAALMGCTVFPAGNGGGGGKPSVSEPPGPPWLAKVQIPPHLRRPPHREEIVIAGDLHDLLTGDFSIYPQAANQLVRRGEIVVPYLGYAAENEIVEAPDGSEGAEVFKARIPITLKQVLIEVPQNHLASCFESPYPAVRLGGAVAAGQRHQTELAPRLVDLLDDPQVDVRIAAVSALRRISNEFFGYRPDASASRRRAATARWRALWASPGAG